MWRPTARHQRRQRGPLSAPRANDWRSKECKRGMAGGARRGAGEPRDKPLDAPPVAEEGRGVRMDRYPSGFSHCFRERKKKKKKKRQASSFPPLSR